jgi:hypothetical protein
VPAAVTADRSVPSRSRTRSACSVPPARRSPGRLPPPRRGPEAVEVAEGRVGVLGEVGGALPRVDGHRLVLEPAQRGDRLRVPAPERVDLVHVAVLHAVDDLVGLLAGQPGAPGRGAAGTVGRRARQAHRMGQEPAVAVHHQRGGASGAVGVVCVARHVGHGRHTVLLDRLGVDLVVAHKDGAAPAATERRHPVVRRGDRPAVVEQVGALSGERPVAKALGQVEQLGRIGHERPVAELPPAGCGTDRRRPGGHHRGQRTGEGQPQTGAPGPEQKRTTRHGVHGRKVRTVPERPTNPGWRAGDGGRAAR